MKVYITDRWVLSTLSTGIKVLFTESKITSKTKRIAASVNPTYRPFHYFSGEWHRTWAEALVRAEEIRQAKIESLEQEIAILRDVVFPATEPEEKTC